MKEVTQNLYCGNEKDLYHSGILYNSEFAFIHACKEPFHRKLLGYKTKGAPKDHPEYLWAERENELYLNIVDAPKSIFFDNKMICKALDFIEQKIAEGLKVFVHCNEGFSRSPSLCLLYLIRQGIITGDTFEDCEAKFLKVYPEYNPGNGIRGFCKEHWRDSLENN